MLLVAVTVLTSLGSLGHCCVHISHRFTSVCFVLVELLRWGGEVKVQPPISGPHTLKSSVKLLSKKRTLDLIHATFLESPLNDFVSTNTFCLSSERHRL